MQSFCRKRPLAFFDKLKALPLLRQSLMIQSYFVTHVFVAAQVR